MWKYSYIDHTADLGVKIVADTLQEIYQAAVFVMFNNILELDKITITKKCKIKIKANSYEELLFNLLKRLLELFYTKGLICKEIKIVKLKENIIKTRIYGSIINFYEIPSEIFKYEIKTVTYHNLEIKKEGNKYTTTIIFDI